MNLGCRKCRREGEKLLLKGDRCLGPKCAVVRRSYAPGQHGLSMPKKLSEYGRQLREKQKLKKIYGLSESILKKYYNISEKNKGNTTEYLVSHLELRLDNIVYRSGIASSRSSARQLVSHGKVLLNSKKVSVPSIIVKQEDVVSFGTGVKFDKINNQNISWFTADPKKGQITIKHIPNRDEIELNINESLVVEFYSR